VKADERARLLARIEDLELRVRLLESRLRNLSGQARLSAQAGEAVRQKREARGPARRRPRCPGCTLELPAGRKGEACVWCGFRFDAVKRLLR
jgi:hypothetical protein